MLTVQDKIDSIVELIRQDPIRKEALDHVYNLGLPQCYIAAGFVRNLVWDSLHGYDSHSSLNDVDVIYFNPNESDMATCLSFETNLAQYMPQLNWQVRNQAFMHKRNGDPSYKSTLDAMRYWPEKETAIAIRKVGQNQYECIAAFGFESLFSCFITHNPNRSRETFENRVKSKGWLVKWPLLKVTS